MADYGPLLQGLIYLNQCKVILEIGVAGASATIHLCEGAKQTGGTVYGYDVWSPHGLKTQFPAFASKEHCEQKLTKEGYSNFLLTKIDTTTQEFKDIINERHPSIDFAFIDGCHSYQGVKNDFSIVYPKLSVAGIIAFHDTLRIDGCREFMHDLRTIYNDGTYDIVDFPFGNQERRVGVSLLVKRSYPIIDIPIDELCNLTDRKELIYQKEIDYHNTQIRTGII
tara:strand:- start:529 stop:1200 length:672 start_codon:yes stop_codon:yes gene_type:complete